MTNDPDNSIRNTIVNLEFHYRKPNIYNVKISHILRPYFTSNRTTERRLLRAFCKRQWSDLCPRLDSNYNVWNYRTLTFHVNTFSIWIRIIKTIYLIFRDFSKARKTQSINSMTFPGIYIKLIMYLKKVNFSFNFVCCLNVKKQFASNCKRSRGYKDVKENLYI